MATARPWSLLALIVTWLLLVSGAAFISFLCIGHVSWVLMPVAVMWLVFAVVRVPGSSRVLAELATHGATVGSWWMLVLQRAVDAEDTGTWLLMAGINVLGAMFLPMVNKLPGGDQRTNLRRTLAVASASLMSLLWLFLRSRLVAMEA